MRNISIFAIILFSLILVGCKNELLAPAEIKGVRISIDETITPDREIEDFVKPYSDHINQTLDSVLAYNPADLNKSEGELNTAIGNLMADIVMEQANPIFKSRTGNDIDM